MSVKHRRIGLTSLLVADYDLALSFYINRLGFVLVEDTALPEEQKRWVVIKPSEHAESALLLVQASTTEDIKRIGMPVGDRVSHFLYTDDFHRDYRRYLEAGVQFLESPRQEVYGTVAVFQDLYGNRWDLLQPSSD